MLLILQQLQIKTEEMAPVVASSQKQETNGEREPIRSNSSSQNGSSDDLLKKIRELQASLMEEKKKTFTLEQVTHNFLLTKIF